MVQKAEKVDLTNKEIEKNQQPTSGRLDVNILLKRHKDKQTRDKTITALIVTAAVIITCTVGVVQFVL
jgi:hypothetical protein|tara:strand:+ start:550 stop:753 length:204 start_codon:yes stop_codon:yes gene_type:complete